MIIRYTVNDNDYTNQIKEFYKHIKFDNAVFFKTHALKLIDEFDNLLKKYIYNKDELTAEDIKNMSWLLDCKFKHYLRQINEDLIHQSSIEVVPMVSDINHNGEYIYYFVETDQIIVL